MENWSDPFAELDDTQQPTDDTDLFLSFQLRNLLAPADLAELQSYPQLSIPRLADGLTENDSPEAIYNQLQPQYSLPLVSSSSASAQSSESEKPSSPGSSSSDEPADVGSSSGSGTESSRVAPFLPASSAQAIPAIQAIPSSPTEPSTHSKELLDRLAMQNQTNLRKRPRTRDQPADPVPTTRKDRHIQTEKKRREELNEGLKQLRLLLPQQLQEKRFTQVEVLNEAAQYFAKVQKLAIDLIEENKRLQGDITASAAAEDSPTRSALKNVNDYARLLMVPVFLVLMTTWLPSQLSGSASQATGSTGRLLQTVLPVALTTSSSRFVSSLVYVLSRVLLFLGALFIVYICVLLDTFVRPRTVNFEAALKEQSRAMSSICAGGTIESQRQLLNALSLLGRPFPDSTAAQLLFILLCYLRALMALIGVGRYFERLALRLGRRSAAEQALEAMSLTGLSHQHTDLISKPFAYTAMTLGLLCGSFALDPSPFMKTKILDTVCFRAPYLWHAPTVILARLLLPASKDGAVSMRDIFNGKMEEVREKWAGVFTTYSHNIPDFGYRRLVSMYAMTYFIEGDYDRALIVLSGVMSHALDSKDKDIAAQVLAVSALCLVRLQKFDDAKRMVQLYSEVVADQNNDRYTLPFTLAQAEMGFVEKNYSEVLGHLARAMEVIERVPMLFHVILAANGLATLIHELMILGKEKSAPALLRDADAQLDKYSKQILFLVVRSALPTRASLLMPLVYRIKGYRRYIRGSITGRCHSAEECWKQSVAYAREYCLPFEETATLQLQLRFLPPTPPMLNV